MQPQSPFGSTPPEDSNPQVPAPEPVTPEPQQPQQPEWQAAPQPADPQPAAPIQPFGTPAVSDPAQPVAPVVPTAPAAPVAPAKKSKKALIWGISIGVVLFLIVIGISIFAFAKGAGEDHNRTQSTTSTETESTDSTAPDDELPLDDIGAIAGGKDPSDLRWNNPSLSSAWVVVADEPGEVTWQFRDTSCALALSQPSGVAASGDTSAQAADRKVSSLATSTGGGTPTAINQDGKYFNIYTSDSMFTLANFAGLRANLPGAKVTVQAYALVRGDFALIVTAGCNDAEFSQYYTTDVEPVISKLTGSMKF